MYFESTAIDIGNVLAVLTNFGRYKERKEEENGVGVELSSE